MKDDRLYLEHILQAIRKIEEYTADGRDAFMTDRKSQDAVLRNFEIIGEATKRLGKECKTRRPDIPWRDIAGLRDVLIHNYMGVKLNRVWGVVERDLPRLRQAVEDLLGAD
ncbi:MAG: DUF86 domain-containing protein [Phycisphaerae bacterium]